MKKIFSHFLFLAIISSTSYAQTPAKPLTKSVAYHELLAEGKTVGKVQAGSENLSNLISWHENSEMRMTLYKQVQNITTQLNVLTDEQLRISSLKFVLKTDQAEISMEGTRSGESLRMRVRQAGGEQIRDVKVQEPFLVSPLIRPYILKAGLPTKSTTLNAYLFEPSALAVVPLQISVSKRPDGNFNVMTKYLSQELSSVMKSDGSLVEETSDLAGLKVLARPITQEKYQALVLQSTQKDLVDVARVDFSMIKNPASLSKFKVNITGIDPRLFALNRHRQSFDGKKLMIESEKLPVKSDLVQSLVGRKDLEAFLRGDTFIPVYEPEIQKTAREIVKTENDLWKRALLIHQYVFSSLKKKPTISVPNALEVLKTKVGDCNEHSALYAALARAAGVPTKLVVGLVYSESFYGKPGFYYHAWVEVFTGFEWVAIDPTWNQAPADATHLAFVEGGMDEQVRITALMGKIKLTPG